MFDIRGSLRVCVCVSKLRREQHLFIYRSILKDVHVLTAGKEKQREPGLLASRSCLITAPEKK
jgi:hypothetical protein